MPKKKKEAPPTPEAPEKKKAKAWSGTWLEGERTKRDPNGGTVTVATVKTNLTDEVDHLYGLAREFSSVVVETADGGQKVNAEVESFAVHAGNKPGILVATMTVAGSRVFS